MEISQEQLRKLLELAETDSSIEIDSIQPVDITKALVSIERKLNFFNTNINFSSANRNQSVLIVDDLELSIYQLTQLLKKIGITPSVARNKDEAIAELRKKTFNYVLIDLFLPDSKDGFELIEEAVRLRNSGHQDFHILIISGTDDKSLIDNCYKLGIDGYIAKDLMWHTEILKYINSTSKKADNDNFNKYVINSNIVSYTIKKFNTEKIFSELLFDINSSVLGSQPNVILNLEHINIFDLDNSFIFAEIYKTCVNNNGNFAIINPSERVKEALSFAYLDGIIPVFSSIEGAVEYINSKKDSVSS